MTPEQAPEPPSMAAEVAALRRENRALREQLGDLWRELSEMREFNENVVASISTGLFAVDRELIIRGWNRSMEEVYGIGSGEVIGQPMRRMFPALDEEGICEATLEVMRSQSAVDYPRFRHRSLRRGPVLQHMRIEPLRSGVPPGEVIGALIVIDDLTEQERLAEELRRKDQFLSNLLHASADAIIGVDHFQRIVSWNRGAEQLFGWSAEDILFEPLARLMPADRGDEWKGLATRIAAGETLTHHRTERLTRAGSRRMVELTRTPLVDSHGQVTGFSEIVRDVTGMMLLERQVRQSERLAVVGQLAAGVAHEIGNPLASISSIVQLIQRRVARGAPLTEGRADGLRDQLTAIRDAIGRIAKIVRELVDFSRPAGYDRKPTDINDLVKAAVGIIRYDQRAKGIEFPLELDLDLPLVSVVPDQLYQVFVNILVNAVDALTESGGTGGWLAVRTERQGDHLAVAFSDSGPGIAPEHLDKLFEPFFTTKEVGRGTGLGLAVSYGIVESFAGQLTVQSTLGRGATFTVLLPT